MANCGEPGGWNSGENSTIYWLHKRWLPSLNALNQNLLTLKMGIIKSTLLGSVVVKRMK